MLETISETKPLAVATLPPRPSAKASPVFSGAEIKMDANYGDDQDPSLGDDEEYARFYTASQAKKSKQQAKDDSSSPMSDRSEQESAFIFDMSAGLEPLYGDPGEDASYAESS